MKYAISNLRSTVFFKFELDYIIEHGKLGCKPPAVTKGNYGR